MTVRWLEDGVASLNVCVELSTLLIRKGQVRDGVCQSCRPGLWRFSFSRRSELNICGFIVLFEEGLVVGAVSSIVLSHRPKSILSAVCGARGCALPGENPSSLRFREGKTSFLIPRRLTTSAVDTLTSHHERQDAAIVEYPSGVVVVVVIVAPLLSPPFRVFFMVFHNQPISLALSTDKGLGQTSNEFVALAELSTRVFHPINTAPLFFSSVVPP